MGAVNTIPAFLDALKVALEARAGLAGVVIRTSDVSHEEAASGSTKEAIILATDPIDDPYDRKTTPGLETFQSPIIRCRTLAVRPVANSATGSEAAIKAARDRAAALLEEVDDYLCSFLGSGNATALFQAALGVDKAEVINARWTQGILPDVGRACEVFFEIKLKAKFTPA